MNYQLLKDVLELVEAYEGSAPQNADVSGFRQWVAAGEQQDLPVAPDWEGKEKGRSPESVISTMLVHLNRYARTYGKAAIHNSPFSTQDEFSYLITLQAFGPMSKMELIKKNIQDKPTGMQIVNRLIAQGWVSQRPSETDKRSKTILLTKKGAFALSQQMMAIRKASRIVTGDLTEAEKWQLIRLLSKLDAFHQPIYAQNIATSELLQSAAAALPQPI